MVRMLRRVAQFFNHFALLMVPYCSGYPGGAPDLACSTMFPTGHSAAAQTSKPPYKIVAQKSAYIPGETIGGE